MLQSAAAAPEEARSFVEDSDLSAMHPQPTQQMQETKSSD
jgi:hypothetical protein